MSKQILAEAGNAMRAGNFAEVAELIDNKLVDSAESPEAKDRLRYARAFALFQSGNPAGALTMLGTIDPARGSTRPVLKLSAAAAMAAGDLDRARGALAALVKGGDREAIRTYQTVLVRRGLDAVNSREYPVALDALRNASIPHIQDIATKFAAWIGLLAAAEGVGDHAAVAQAFAMFPEWHEDRRANMIAARAAIARLDAQTALAHLNALGTHADAWPLWWLLAKGLLAKTAYKDVVALFGEPRPGMPEKYAKAVQTAAAIALYALRKNDDAQYQVEQLALKFPDDKLVAHAAGFLAYSAGNHARCETHLRRVEDDSDPVMLLRWATMFAREKYEPIRDALNPEAVRAWPDGSERDAASMMAALANTLLGSPSRGWALLRTSGDPGRVTASAANKYLGGYLALVEGQYPLAAGLLGAAPLAALARIESARDFADAGGFGAALAELEYARGKGLDATVADTRSLINLQQAQECVKSDDMASAQRLLAQVRAEAPHLADRVAGLEDYVAVRATLKSVKGADPARVGAVLWDLYGATPVEASEAQASARRRDLAYLTGVMRLRALSGARVRGMTAQVIDALEASLDEDFTFPPAAAVLGVILNHRGDPRRALELLDVANQGGLSTPSIQAALAVAYVHDGRLVEAKRIFLDQMTPNALGSTGDPSSINKLREIFAQEAAPLLDAPSRVEAPAIAMPKTAMEAPDMPGAVDPFAGIDVKQRMFALIHHAEARGTPELADIARELKRASISGPPPNFADIEQRALALMGAA